jgi:hypothetical protein
MSQIKSEMTKSAEGYVASFLKGEAFPGGFSYREELKRCNLDFSMESLKRIDAMLDQIRANDAPKIDDFLENHANQHFLHCIAFYAGKVAGLNAGIEAEWHTREEAIAIVPQLQHVWKEDLYETSIVCMFVPKGGGSQQYPPLLSICTRLFDAQKSVFASASGIKMALNQNLGAGGATSSAKSSEKPAEGWFKKFRRILNSI